MNNNYFRGNTGKADQWNAATSNIVSAASSIAKDALSSASKSREEVAFNAIYDSLIENWQSQADTFIKQVFDGGKNSLNTLTKMFSDGKMITGGRGEDSDVDPDWVESNHTDSWIAEKNIERAFYAAAIPAAWTANRPAPVVVDFGPSCEIDARKYFREDPESYNFYWRCIDGHSYILAGVRDGPQQVCGPSNPGGSGGCNPNVQKWTFSILDGANKLKGSDNQWGGVTVDDLIHG